MTTRTELQAHRRRAGALLLTLLLLAAVPLVRAQTDGSASDEGEVTLNLKNADISALIDTVSDVTGRNFVVDPRVRAKVTVVSKRAMEAEELYRVFLSILQVHGFSAVPSGEVTKIIPDANAKQQGPTDGDAQDAGDQLVTQVIPVKNVPVAQIVPVLRPLIPQQGHFAAYPPTNVLIISDRAANVDRMARIVDRIDRAGSEEVEVVQLENAAAAEVVRILQSLQQGRTQQEGAGPSLELAADERTNSVLMSGPEKERLRMRTMIAHLDTPLEQEGDTQVVYLRYAKAEDLAEVLRGVSENLQAQKSASEGTDTSRNDSEVSIQPDASTNALVISAPPRVQEELDAVIQRLDVRRAQVMIEAAIVEVSMDAAAELGVQWAVDGTGDGGAGGTNFDTGSGNSLASLIRDLREEEVPNIGSGLSMAVGDLTGGTRFATLLRALRSDAGTNVLSTPTLVTLDNQEAEIRVAENVPFVTGSFTDSGSSDSSVNPFQTIEREDVGLILKMTPQINEGNSVMLDLEQEVSSVTDSTQAVDLITNKRSIRTSVLADDGNLVILGGLVDDQVRETEQRVPVLGSIPVLGNLFRYQRSTSTKRNLMVFLRPRIVRTSDGMGRYASDKYNYIRAQQLAKRQEGVDLLPDDTAPVLPELGRPELPAPFIR